MEYTTRKNYRLTGIETTSDELTSRAGLALFVRYLEQLNLFPMLSTLFGRIRKSSKGQSIADIFQQVLVFLVDGTSRHLSYFDALRAEDSHAGILGMAPERLLSSHTVKRFFKAFSLPLMRGFRQLLQTFFIWRLKIAKPVVVVLGLDTVVLDNDEATKRHGVTPTYRKVKGFQPLQLVWGRFIIDALFRRGSKNGNQGKHAARMIRRAVVAIRTHYQESVPIIVRMDSGFFDDKLFRALEALGVGYVCGGRLYEAIKDRAREQETWSAFHNGHQTWRYFAFSDQRQSWSRSRRAIYTQPLDEDGQMILEFARPDLVIYTNLGNDEAIDRQLAATGHGEWIQEEQVIRIYHGRGRDELIHRAQKDFTSERLPFKYFGPNMAFYYTGLVAFFLFEAFKEDVGRDVIAVESYPTTVRRQLFDVAGKFVRHAGSVVLKVTKAVMERLKFRELWERANLPPSISLLGSKLSAQNRSI